MAKGSQSERETAKELSIWWAGRSDIFWRTAGSGGRATMRSKQDKDTKYAFGDITFTDPIGKPLIDFLLIENKSGYKDGINILDFVDSPNKFPQLLKWWWKSEKERKKSGRYYSVIIFRRNRKAKCIMIPTPLFCACEDWCGEYKGNTIDLYHDEGEWVVIEFVGFLRWVTPESIIQMLKERGWKDEDNS